MVLIGVEQVGDRSISRAAPASVILDFKNNWISGEILLFSGVLASVEHGFLGTYP